MGPKKAAAGGKGGAGGKGVTGGKGAAGGKGGKGKSGGDADAGKEKAKGGGSSQVKVSLPEYTACQKAFYPLVFIATRG